MEKLSEETVSGWLETAPHPVEAVLDEMDEVLTQVSRSNPVWVFFMRKDLKRLRKYAGDLGLSWGTPR